MAVNLAETCLLVSGLKSSDCASWVQAWGSIGAICAAWWIASRQYKLGQRDAHQKEIGIRRQLVASISNILEFSLVIFERVMALQHADICEFLNYKVDSQQHSLRRDAFAVDSYLAALQKIDSGELYDSVMSEQLMLATFALDVLRQHLDNMRSIDHPHNMEPAYVFGPISGAFAAISKARKTYVDSIF
ncbi:MAG: hypothetical protein ABI410_15285, partial [Rhodoferax sp.]